MVVFRFEYELLKFGMSLILFGSMIPVYCKTILNIVNLVFEASTMNQFQSDWGPLPVPCAHIQILVSFHCVSSQAEPSFPCQPAGHHRGHLYRRHTLSAATLSLANSFTSHCKYIIKHSVANQMK